MHKLRYLLYSLFIASLLLHAGCSRKVPGLQSFPPMEQQGYTKATVKSYTSDGCTWLLVLENGKKLQPAFLDIPFQKDGLAVWLKYEVTKSNASICMTGQPVNITDIQNR